MIEKTGKVTDVATDKTGTLTRGFFKVLDRYCIVCGIMACLATIIDLLLLCVPCLLFCSLSIIYLE